MDDLTLDLLIKELDITDQEVHRLPGPLDLRGLFDLSKIDRPELHYPRARPDDGPPLPAARGQQPRRSLPRDPQVRRPGAPPVRVVRDQRAGVPRAGGQGPARPRHQADAVPHLRRQPHRAGADRCGRVRQAGARPRRGEGAVRRGGATSSGRASSRRPACTSCTASSASRRTASSRSSSAKRTASSSTTATSARATTTRRRAASTRTSGSSRSTTRSVRDLTRLFNELSGYAIEKKFKRLLVAPLHLRKGLLRQIDRERRNALDGKPSRIRIKVNSMVDEQIIDALYRASQAGVPVEIWVRGICSLKPGRRPGMSENITVRSILGRYLEHSRIFSFQNDGDPQVYIGSADMMHRNLDRRVEALVQGRRARPHQGAAGPLHPCDVGRDQLVVARSRGRMDPAQRRRDRQAAHRHPGPHDEHDPAPPSGAGGAMTETAVLRGRRRRVAPGRGQAHGAAHPPHRVSRPHSAQGQGRARRDARRDRRARDLRRDRHPRTARHPGRRLALPHAQQAREDRALLVGRGHRCRDQDVRLRAQPRDRGDRVDVAEEGAQATELSGRRGDPRELPPLRRRRSARHLPADRAAAREGAFPRRVEGEGYGAPAVAARPQTGERRRRAASRLRARAGSSRRPPCAA